MTIKRYPFPSHSIQSLAAKSPVAYSVRKAPAVTLPFGTRDPHRMFHPLYSWWLAPEKFAFYCTMIDRWRIAK